MNYLHSMIRVSDLDQTLDFFCGKLGLVETSRQEIETPKYSLVYLAAPEDVRPANVAARWRSAYAADRATFEQQGEAVGHEAHPAADTADDDLVSTFSVVFRPRVDR